jgi:hypothetical protein
MQHYSYVETLFRVSGTDQPAFRIYSVVPCAGKDDDWFEIGVAFPHPDGRGFNVMLQAQPLNGKLVLREFHEKKQREGERLSLAELVDAFERAVIERCFVETGGKVSGVLERLTVPRRTLSEKMARLGINRQRFISAAATIAGGSGGIDNNSAPRNMLSPQDSQTK